MKFSADEEKLDPDTATKLNMVLDKIIELVLSNDTISQLRGVKSIETLLKTRKFGYYLTAGLILTHVFSWSSTLHCS